MPMELKIAIFVLAGLPCLVSTLTTPGRSIAVTEIPASQTQLLHSPESNHQSTFFADNNSRKADGGTQTASGKENQASKSGSTTTEKPNQKSNDEASKPLKPFKPSEEIAAEQAVDFPVDI